MSQYQEYAEKPAEFLALTGYTRQEFDALLPHFRDSYYQWMRTIVWTANPVASGNIAIIRTVPTPDGGQAFFILNYLKTNNLQTVQGAFFGISQPKANVWIHCLHPILNQSLAALGELPARKMEDVTFDETEMALYFHDGTERPIQRPRDPDQQRLYYSGKKTARGQK